MIEHPGLSGARAFVTGAHGFIGRAVVRLLAEAGAEVKAPYKADAGPSPGLPATTMELDLLDEDAVRRAVRGADHVIHLAARSGGIQFQDQIDDSVYYDNQHMTRNVLRGAVDAGVQRLFLASSAVVYAPGTASPIGEDSPLVRPGESGASPYAWSKVCDEVVGRWYADSGRVATVAGRFTNVYGPGGSFDPDRATVIHAVVQRALREPLDEPLEVWGDGSPVRSFVYAEDAARAVLTILTRGQPGQAYNVDSSEAVSIGDVAAVIAKMAGRRGPLKFLEDRPQGVAHRVLDNARLVSLGFAPSVLLEEGVRRTIASCLSRGAE